MEFSQNLTVLIKDSLMKTKKQLTEEKMFIIPIFEPQHIKIISTNSNQKNNFFKKERAAIFFPNLSFPSIRRRVAPPVI